MINIRYIIGKIKDIRARDFLDIFPMLLAFILRPFFKERYKKAWLISDEPYEARDNGFHFYKYICENHTEQDCYFAIKKKADDYKKIVSLGKAVEFGSVRHWIIYLTCEYNIVSQKSDGKPNGNICIFLELLGTIKIHNVFLQHGVTINNARWLYTDKARFDLFITATNQETAYIKENFGYNSDTIQQFGFCRYDALHDDITKPNRILIMPTWRGWFSLASKRTEKTDSVFESSDYLRCWKALLTSNKFKNLIVKYNLDVIFYPHRNMQRYLDSFRDVDNIITIASWKEFDVQTLMRTSKMMITDYSSVFFDMVYMKKPIIFFQFDEEEFRKNHYQEGWFNYHENVFGPFCRTADEVISNLECIVKNNYMVSQDFLDEHAKTFLYYDSKNSERLYKYLSNLKNSLS